MNEEQAQRIQEAIYKAVREAVSHELLIYHEATVVPMMNLQIEMQKSLAMIVQGQAMVESKLADSMANPEDDEPWRESLGGD